MNNDNQTGGEETTDIMTAGNGWVSPPGSRKWHYFEETLSLCGRYGFMRERGDKDTGNYTSADCAKCVKILKKRKEKEQ